MTWNSKQQVLVRTDSFGLVPWFHDPDVSLAVDVVLRVNTLVSLEHLVALLQLALSHVRHSCTFAVNAKTKLGLSFALKNGKPVFIDEYLKYLLCNLVVPLGKLRPLSSSQRFCLKENIKHKNSNWKIIICKLNMFYPHFSVNVFVFFCADVSVEVEDRPVDRLQWNLLHLAPLLRSRNVDGHWKTFEKVDFIWNISGLNINRITDITCTCTPVHTKGKLFTGICMYDCTCWQASVR